MTDRFYDFLKYMQRIALPALLGALATVLPLFGVQDETVRIIAQVGGVSLSLFGVLLQGVYNNWKTNEKGEDDNG